MPKEKAKQKSKKTTAEVIEEPTLEDLEKEELEAESDDEEIAIYISYFINPCHNFQRTAQLFYSIYF